MSNYVTLIGSEDVQSAGYRILEAAQEMSRAASNIEDSLHRHRMYLDGFLQRFEDAIEKLEPKS